MRATSRGKTTEKRICCECVGEAYLSDQVQITGTVASCHYCEDALNPTWSISELADRVETAFADHFSRTSPDPSPWQQHLLADPEEHYWWDREGERTEDAIQSAADIPKGAAVDVQGILANRCYDLDAARMGDELEFSSDAHYELKNLTTGKWHQDWRSFEQALKFEARFFSRIGASRLEAIFQDIDTLRTGGRAALIVDAGPKREIDFLYRARVFQSDDRLLDALCSPDRHLGAPPSAIASAGRMNAPGISVFYGATEPDTAIAEVRPPVGSKVAVARFVISRPLRLLDLTLLENLEGEGSVFDPTFKERLERISFLRTLGARISRPVMPDDQAFEYLPTQAIADYLATENEPQVDGVIFSSAQFTRGLNVVLFHKAARVAAISLPENASVDAYIHTGPDDDPEIEYSVCEWVTSQPKKSKSRPFQLPSPARSGTAHNLDTREVSLSVDPGSIVVHHVNSVAFNCTAYSVDRQRIDKDKLEF